MEASNTSLFFNEWLKDRRKVLDLTQEELARRAGCSMSALRKIESGERRPSKQLAQLLAEALEIPEEDRQTFVRVARGELNIGRLRQPRFGALGSSSDFGSPQQAQSRAGSLAPASRLPLQATPLIGREPELAALERLFNESPCRLLTLTGIGGIGKTRLAIEFASRKIPTIGGGVFYVPLAPVDAPEKLIPTLADALDFRFSGPSDPKEQLFGYISNNIRQEVLFVLDNLEHLLVQNSTVEGKAGVAQLVSESLARLPNVRILATSRERLNVHGEWTFELHGLAVPPIDFVGPLEVFDSVTLFVKSAQRASAAFQATGDEQTHVVRICQLVEGVPLAIELAAAWVALLSCREIAEEIRSSMDFLTTSMRDVPERHRSIRATFDHSWGLLSDAERRALSQLAIFHGGFDRQAAAVVAGASLALLASLIAKSLVRRDESGRYDLHEVIRQYALTHLEGHPLGPATCERHSDYYLAFLRDRESALKSASQQDAIRQLTDEIDNIRAAWAWAVTHRRFSELGQAGRAFGWYFEITGLYREGLEQLEMLVEALETAPPDGEWQRVLALALIQQALLHFRIGEFDRAREHYEEGISILRPGVDQTLLADALIYRGTLQHLNGEYEPARESVEEGLAYARAGNEQWLEAFGAYNLGHIAGLIGRYEQGYEQMQAGLALWRTVGDPQAIAMGLNFLVQTLIQLGRYEEAKSLMHESITLCAQSKNRWGMATAYRYLGLAHMAAGEFAEAQIHLRKSLEIFGDTFEGWDIARSLAYLADASLMSGELDGAERDYRNALRLAMEMRAVPIALDALLGLANLQAQAGKAEYALMLSTFVLNHPSSEEETRSRAEHLRQALQKKLAAEQVEAAGAQAEKWDLELIAAEFLDTA